MFLCLFILFSFFSLSACVSGLKDRRKAAEQLASYHHFEKRLVKTPDFIFTTYQKANQTLNSLGSTSESTHLVIYIEGDGRSWKTRTEPSEDPTPLNPLALKLALLDPRPNVVYLARPCQFTEFSLNPGCKTEIWTDQRFSKQVVNAMSTAIDKIKRKNHRGIHLIGFSGGGGIAVLLAANRKDIVSITTVAADLDHEAMTAYHRTSPLKGSLNPKHFASKVAQIPQHHYVGGQDPIVQQFVSEGFIDAMHCKNCTSIQRTVIENATHHEGWEKVWKEKHFED